MRGMQSHITFPSLVCTTSARFPALKEGSTPMPSRLGSSSRSVRVWVV
jgi:hypothetical protein